MIDYDSARRFPEYASTTSIYNCATLSTRTSRALGARKDVHWCETSVLSHDVIALSIGNVQWHGDETFGTMTALRETLRDATGRGADPAEALVEGNLLMHRSHPDALATAIVALLDTTRQKVTLSNAGHPSPLMVCAERRSFLTQSGTALPLGSDEAYVPMIRSFRVPDETLLVFYTEGVNGHRRNALQTAVRLRNAATFAYRTCSLPTASSIERHMRSPGTNERDASMLTAWTAATA